MATFSTGSTTGWPEPAGNPSPPHTPPRGPDAAGLGPRTLFPEEAPGAPDIESDSSSDSGLSDLFEDSNGDNSDDHSRGARPRVVSRGHRRTVDIVRHQYVHIRLPQWVMVCCCAILVIALLHVLTTGSRPEPCTETDAMQLIVNAAAELQREAERTEHAVSVVTDTGEL